jgi:outer membrane biogenesis lipoprotein LolB
MQRILGFLLAAVAVALMTACAGDKPEDPNNVSTIPWNRPEKWEGQGPMGGMMPGSQ